MLERLVARQLVAYLDANRLLPSTQSGQSWVCDGHIVRPLAKLLLLLVCSRASRTLRSAT